MNLDGLSLTATPPTTPWRNRFVITLTYMHGDADMDTYEELIALDREALNDFFVVADRYFAWGWNEQREHVENLTLNGMPEYWIFTSADSKEEYANDEHRGWWEEYWPCDKTNDCWNRTRLTGYEIFYYDENGTEFSVTRESDK